MQKLIFIIEKIKKYLKCPALPSGHPRFVLAHSQMIYTSLYAWHAALSWLCQPLWSVYFLSHFITPAYLLRDNSIEVTNLGWVSKI